MLKTPAVRIAARDAEAEFNAVPIRDAKQVASVVEKFRAKYGAGDVKEVLFEVGCCGCGFSANAKTAPSRREILDELAKHEFSKGDYGKIPDDFHEGE